MKFNSPLKNYTPINILKIFITLTFLAVSCRGIENQHNIPVRSYDKKQDVQSDNDGLKADPELTKVSFTLPTRESLVDAQLEINSYLTKAVPQIKACAPNLEYISKGLFEGGKKVFYYAHTKCDLTFSVEIGFRPLKEKVPAQVKLIDDSPHRQYYLETIFPIFDRRCIGCHAPLGSRSISDLTTYDSSMQFLNQIAKHTIQQTMPLGSPLPSEESEVILQWVESVNYDPPTENNTKVDEDPNKEVSDKSRSFFKPYFQSNVHHIFKNTLGKIDNLSLDLKFYPTHEVIVE